MRRRLAIAALVALATLPFAQPAEAHEIERFTACVALTSTTPECSRQGAVLDAGATVYLRGRVSPAHPGFGEVWRRSPYAERFVRVGTMGVNEEGRIRWSWVTDSSDVASAPYTFQFRIPGHGNSWTTKVRVRRPAPTATLCAAVSSTDAHCYNAGATYEGGQIVFLRGRVQPAAVTTVRVLRESPGAHQMSVVATVQSDDIGRVRWRWRTRDRDVNGSSPYLLALELPGGQRSNLVEVWVVHNDV